MLRLAEADACLCVLVQTRLLQGSCVARSDAEDLQGSGRGEADRKQVTLMLSNYTELFPLFISLLPSFLSFLLVLFHSPPPLFLPLPQSPLDVSLTMRQAV